MHNSKRGERECNGENMNGLFDSSKLFDCQKNVHPKGNKKFWCKKC